MVKAARDDYRLNGYCIHLKQGKGLNRVNTTAEVKKKISTADKRYCAAS